MVQNYSLTDGAARWLAGAVRTLQKRVEMLEAKNSFEHHDDTSVPSHKPDDNVETGDTNTELQIPKRRKVGEWKYDKVRVRRPRRHAVWTTQSCSVPALDIPVATTPMDEYVTFAPTTEFVTPPVVILDATATPAATLSDLLEPTVPDEYAVHAPCPEAALEIPEATAPVDEYVTSAPTTEFVTQAAAILAATATPVTVLYDFLEPLVPVEYPLADYISWLDTGPSPDNEKYFISMTRSQAVRYAARTIQWGWRWMHRKTEIRAASEEKLQSKLREVRRRFVEKLPVGASPKKTEHLKDIHSTLKEIENEWKMILYAELKEQEIESRRRSRTTAWFTVMYRETAEHGRLKY